MPAALPARAQGRCKGDGGERPSPVGAAAEGLTIGVVRRTVGQVIPLSGGEAASPAASWLPVGARGAGKSGGSDVIGGTGAAGAACGSAGGENLSRQFTPCGTVPVLGSAAVFGPGGVCGGQASTPSPFSPLRHVESSCPPAPLRRRGSCRAASRSAAATWSRVCPPEGNHHPPKNSEATARGARPHSSECARARTRPERSGRSGCTSRNPRGTHPGS